MLKIIKYFFISSILIVLLVCLWFFPTIYKINNEELADTTCYDVVIIPGVPFIAPHWNKVMEMRLIWATHLYQTKKATHIITSGSSVYSPYVEAKIMKAYLVKMGVPADSIFTEEEAQHSTENLWYGYQLAIQKGYKKIAFSSDPFQTRVLYSFAEEHTPTVKFLPVIFDTLKVLSHAEPKINYDS